MKSTGKIVSYASGSIPANLVSLAFGSYVQFYYIDQLHGDPKWIGLAAAIQAIYATLVYPFLGHLSDRTQSRWGRRVPFIVYGAVPLGVSFMLVWAPPVAASHVLLFTAYFFVTALFYDTMFNLTMVNWSALFPEMFHSAPERSYASAWKQMFGIIGLIAGLALPTMIAHAIGWPIMGVVFGILSIITLLTTIPSMELKRRSREHNTSVSTHAGLSIGKALKHTLVNKSFITFVGMRIFVQFAFTMLTADLSYYAKYDIHLNGNQQSYLLLGTLIVALPLVYVWSWLVPRIGGSRSALLAIGLFGFALIPFFFAQTFMTALLCGLGLGVGLSGILMLTDVLISDVIDEDELKTGVRREGMFYGIHGLLIGLTTPAQAIITSWVLVSTHYVSDQPTQSASALFGFRIMITVIPFVALVIGFLLFLLYPLRKQMVAINQSNLNQSGEQQISL
jgi:glycoside/pentoside/hexuronide:cation symporter, GPH family